MSRPSRTAARALTACALAGLAFTGIAGTAMAAPSAVDPQAMQSILDKHNHARAEVGVAPLSWDNGLAADAQAWADHLAAQGGGLVHDANRGNEGENLASYSDANISPADGVDLWYAEKPLYDAAPNKTTYDDTNPDWKTWGHYSQMVWSGTTQVGCGTATGAFGRVTDCRYRAPGNIQGQQAYQPGGTKTPQPGTTDEAQCAYNPQGKGGYGSYVDGLALDVRDWELDMTNAINAYRQQHGVAPLTYSRTLARPAMWASLDDYDRNTGPTDARHTDSRGMGVAERVQYCSGYTGKVYELAYYSHDIAGSKWQAALDFWLSRNSDVLLDPSYTTSSGVQMAYGNNDTDRNPAYYTLVLGDH